MVQVVDQFIGRYYLDVQVVISQDKIGQSDELSVDIALKVENLLHCGFEQIRTGHGEALYEFVVGTDAQP